MSLFWISVLSAVMGTPPVVLGVYHDFFGALISAIVQVLHLSLDPQLRYLIQEIRQVFISSTVCNAFVVLLVITVHSNREALTGTVLSTFIDLDSRSFVLPVEPAAVGSGSVGDGIRSRRTAD
jgi:hypothetical protein